MKIFVNNLHKLIIVLLFLVTACSPNAVYISQLSDMAKDMTFSQVDNLLNKTPKNELSGVKLGTNDEYVVRLYELMSGSYESDFLFTFRNGKLYYWGYIHEYARSNNKLLNEIGRKALEAFGS